MDIKFNIINNLCFAATDGAIDITSINLTEAEILSFGEYRIEWLGDLEHAVISNNQRILTNLKNGTYSFKLISLFNNITSNIYRINITSPDLLEIQNINISKISCENNGYVDISISGGVPPYTYCLNGSSHISSLNHHKFENLFPGTYSLTVIDLNKCFASHNFIIEASNIEILIDQIISPQKVNGVGGVSFGVVGNGPFSIVFESENTSRIVRIGPFDTDYITNINNNQYNYIINNLYPDNYNMIITDNNGCTKTQSIHIPNIDPILVRVNVSADTTQNIFPINQTIPIFDTLLIPYKFIINNTLEWQTIQSYNINNYLPVTIDEKNYKFLITRTMLDKYILTDNKIEILKLGNTDKDWFFCLQLAPSINLDNNPEFINAKIELISKNSTNIPITLGLDINKQLDTDNISLIRGSFIVAGIIDAQFKNKTACCLSRTNQISDINQYDYRVENIKVSTHRNLYTQGVVTIVNFIENLIGTTSLYQNFCDLDTSQYNNIINIKNLLISLNQPNDIFIYATGEQGNGSIVSSVRYQKEFYFLNQTIKNHIYINYYYFNEDSIKLSNLLLNNELAQNILSLSDIKSGFYIIKIKDEYNNTPYVIINNERSIVYETHHVEAKALIQQYNPNILPFFQNGDILVYVPKTNNDSILDQILNIPTISKININSPIFIRPKSHLQTVSQTQDSNNTSSMNIQISPPLTKCIINGPNNYFLEINRDTKLINMIPGVYTIKGNEEELRAKNLYQNYIRILVDKNREINTNIKFESYKDKILIKE